MKDVRVGLIGCGYWGSNLARVLVAAPGVSLRAVCDTGMAARERARKIAPSTRVGSVVADLLAGDDVDALVVATPVDQHFEIAMQGLKAGKHVLVEKPITRTLAQALDLDAEARARGLVLMVGHTFLYNGAVRRVKAIIDSGDLGDIHYVVSRRLNLGIVRSDVDVLWNLAPHDISILNYWIGRPVTGVNAVGQDFLRPGIADVAFIHLGYAGNIGGHVHVSWLDPHKVRQATVVGSKKMLVFDDTSTDARIALFDKGIDPASLDRSLGGFDSYAEHRLIVRAGDVWLPRIDFNEPLAEEVAEFAAAIQEGRSPLTDGQNAIEVVKVLERAAESMQAQSLRDGSAANVELRRSRI